MGDHYKELGVPTSADAAAIKKAYRKLVQANHPDQAKAQGWSEIEATRREKRVARINAAFDVLGDVQKRRAYDMRARLEAAAARAAAQRARAEAERAARDEARRREAERRERERAAERAAKRRREVERAEWDRRSDQHRRRDEERRAREQQQHRNHYEVVPPRPPGVHESRWRARPARCSWEDWGACTTAEAILDGDLDLGF